VPMIMHTGDLHLREYGDERWESLQHLLEAGKEQKIDLLVISGDLFDRHIDAEKLANRFRQAVNGAGFPVFILPGNHDREAYGGGRYFGEGVEVITDPAVPLECGDVVFWGLPYAPLEESEIIKRLHALSEKAPGGKYNVLLFHGELLEPRFSRRDMGEEGEQRYMPVKLSCFENLRFDYVLAGHYHSNFRIWQYPAGYYVYPGSPVSVTKREKGRRKANLFKIGDPPREHFLDTFHFEEVVVELDPFSTKNPLERIEKELEGTHPSSLVELRLKGFFNGEALGLDERGLMRKVHQAVSPRNNIRVLPPEFKDISSILDDRLTERFMEKLNERMEHQEFQKNMRDMFVQALLEAKS